MPKGAVFLRVKKCFFSDTAHNNQKMTWTLLVPEALFASYSVPPADQKIPNKRIKLTVFYLIQSDRSSVKLLVLPMLTYTPSWLCLNVKMH